MSRHLRVKAALIVLLIGTAIVRPLPSTPPWMTLALVLFAVVNIGFPVPGTQWIRMAAVVATAATLVWPRQLAGSLLIAAIWVWPLAILLAGATARERESDATCRIRGSGARGATRAKTITAGLVVAVASLVYRWLVFHRLEQSAALFVGIPALLAILVVFKAAPRSAAGVACKAVTIGLLVSMLFLWEGALCVVMSAPLFYAIAVLIGGTVDFARRRLDKRAQTTLSCLAILVLIPMSLEGVTEATSFNRDEWVAESKIVHAPPDSVARAILEPPRFDRPLPLYLRSGFPRATSIRIDRNVTPHRFVVSVKGGEMRLNGMEPRTGELVLGVEEMRPGLVRWFAISDDSHMTHYLRWREAQVEWQALPDGSTRVTWKLRYTRGLDPAWYFGPWERYAAKLAAGYLIDSIATP
jgi:hypothetical protein